MNYPLRWDEWDYLDIADKLKDHLFDKFFYQMEKIKENKLDMFVIRCWIGINFDTEIQFCYFKAFFLNFFCIFC